MTRTSSTAEAGPEQRSEAPAFALLALVTVLLGQVTRVLFPIMFEIGEDWDFVAAGLVAMGVFVSPVLAWILVAVPRRAAIPTGALMMALALVALRLADPIQSWLAIVGVSAALIGFTILVVRMPWRSSMSRGFVPTAIVTGLAIDTTIKAAFRSWDLAWQSGAGSLVVTVLVAGGVVFTAAFVARTIDRAADPTGERARPRMGIALGAYAMLHVLFLHNVGFVAAQADLPVAPAAAVVLLGDLTLVFLISRMPDRTPRALAVAIGGLAGLALAWLLTSVAGVPAAGVVFVLIVLTGAGLVIADGAAGETVGFGRDIFAIAVGGVLFLALILVWQIYLDRELPLPREAVPVIAAAFVARRALEQRAAPTAVLRGHVESTAMRGIAALAFAVPLVLWLTQPSVDSTIAADSVRIVNYNTRGSVDINGQVRPDRIAREIASSDPHVVVLQEVGRGWPIHATTDLLTYLQRDLHMDYVFEPAGDQQFGNVILSRLPMTELAAAPLPEDGTQDRSFILVSVETTGGDLAVAGTHLHSRSVRQISALLEAVEASTLLVIAGDMNFAPDDPEPALFAEAGFLDVVGATGDPCRTTSMEPTSDCDRPDWVFVSTGLTIESVRIGRGGASDHLAQHVTVRIGG